MTERREAMEAYEAILASSPESRYVALRPGARSPTGQPEFPSQGISETRLPLKRQLREMVLYSPQHVDRLERTGQFPKRVRLGQNQVGWLESEVVDWLRKRLDARDVPTDAPE